MKNISLTLIFVVILSVYNSISAQTSFDIKKMNELFDVLETNNRMMGSVTLMKDGKVIYSRVLGYRNINDNEKIKSDVNTKFRIGSITKVFTAVMIFQLIEEKKLSLDTKLSKFFPNIPNADRITIEQMLSHRSGLASYPRGANYNDPKNWIYQPQTREQMLERFMAAKPDFEPGKKHQYSNTNFALLGYIIESLTHSTYAAQLDRRIIKKIGLKNTRFGGIVDDSKNEAHSYNYRDSKWEQVLEQDLSIGAGAGAVVSTTTDLAKFIEAIFNHKLMRDDSLKNLITPPDNLDDNGRGLGVFKVLDTGKSGFQHDGGVDGFTSLLSYVKEDNLSFAIIINGHNYPMNRTFFNVYKIFYNKSLTIPSFKPVNLSPETLSRYEGVFACQALGMKITIKKDGESLMGEVAKDDTFHLTATGETIFFHEPSGIIIEFKQDTDGSIPNFTMFQGRGTTVWKKE